MSTPLNLAIHSNTIIPISQGLAEVGGPSLWGGGLEGEVAEVLDVFEVGVAGEVADAAVEVESELGGEGGGVGAEAVLVAALGEGD